MWKVFVTRRIPEAGLDLLRKETRMEMNPNPRVLSREELFQSVQGKDGLLTLLTDKIDKEAMEAAGPSLKVISNYAVGYDNIDLAEAKRRRIMVTNTPDVLTETCADFTWALLLGIARRISESEVFTRAGKFEAWDPLLMLGSDVFGKTLGIAGFGRIGRAVARRAVGFSMKTVLYHPKQQGEIQDLNAKFVPLETLLQESDFVTLHLPLTPETKHFIGKKELHLMKPSAYLINTSRGPIIDEGELAHTLQEKQIAGAALDVYEKEPRIHPGLLSLTNVLLTPHIASASWETRSKMGVMAAANLLAALRGEKPPNPVFSL